MTRPPTSILRHLRTLLLASLVAVVSLLGVVWRNAEVAQTATAPVDRRLDTPSRAGARIDSTTDRSGVSAAAARNGTASPAPVQGHSRTVRGTLTAGRDAYERARNLGAVFNALQVQSGADALFFAQRALRDCQPFLNAATQAGQPPPMDRYRPAPPDHPMTARREAAYAALQVRCSGFDLGADPAATAKALRDALLAINDPRAALEQAATAVRRGGAPADAMDKVRAAAADGDPYALEQASAVMSAMRGRYVFVLDGQVVKPDIIAAGWMMAACDAGRSCGDEWVQAPCAFLTECDALDLESSLQRYQLSPAEYDAMQQVRARVMRGVAGGQWDPALFAPQPAPPGYRRWGP